MASIQSIAKAKALALALQKITGVEPSLSYETDHVLIYYQPDRLKQVQTYVEKIAASGKKPGDVRVNWMPVVTPFAVKKAVPYVLGILAVGYVLGKAT